MACAVATLAGGIFALFAFTAGVRMGQNGLTHSFAMYHAVGNGGTAGSGGPVGSGSSGGSGGSGGSVSNGGNRDTETPAFVTGDVQPVGNQDEKPVGNQNVKRHAQGMLGRWEERLAAREEAVAAGAGGAGVAAEAVAAAEVAAAGADRAAAPAPADDVVRVIATRIAAGLGFYWRDPAP